MTPDWYLAKARAFALAWQRRFGRWATVHTVTLGLLSPLLETRCGDSWPNSNNWGACTLRRLTQEERAAIADAGLRATIGADHATVAAQAQAAIVAAGLPLPQGVIHCDSTTDSNGTHAYFVWFATFTAPWLGADYWLRIVCGAHGARGACQVLREAHSQPEQLAAAMYRQRYYWGMHPHGTPDGDAANIRDYAAAMRRFLPAVTRALTGWSPDKLAPLPPPAPRLPLSRGMVGDDVRHVQLVVSVDPDGAWGPMTDAAVSRWRRAHALPVPPVQWDANCEAELGTVPPESEPAAPRLRLVELQPDWAAMRAERDGQLLETP